MPSSTPSGHPGRFSARTAATGSRCAAQSRHVVGYLREFLFRDEQARQPVRALSGGERNRLLLALILARPANLLVLDEPTNDLDIETLDLLEEMLADHTGTLLLVSHDRDFVDRLVTSTIVIEGDGRAREYAGGYTDWLAQRPPPLLRQRRVDRQRLHRRLTRPHPFPAKLQRELDRLPERLSSLEQEIAAVEAALGRPQSVHPRSGGFRQRGRAAGGLRDNLAGLEERWLELEAMRDAHPG